MEAHESEYLQKNLTQLLKLIMWSSMFSSSLGTDGVVSELELKDLEDITVKSKRTEYLIDILKTKKKGYTTLVDALKESNQSGAVELLEAIPKIKATNSSAGTTTTVHTVTSFNTTAVGATTVNTAAASNTTAVAPEQGTPSDTENQLKFPDRTHLVNDVIQKVRPALLEQMTNGGINAKIISQIAALGVFDYGETDHLVQASGEYSNQQKRMTELFRLIAILEREDILLCLNKLCNLDDLPKLSKRIRNIFRNCFPDSI